MALGAEHNFEMHRGDDKEITFTVVEEDLVTPVDITGATFTWVLARKDADSTIPSGPALVTKTESSGVVVVDAPTGKVRVDLGPGDTTGLVPGEYYQECEMVLTKTSTVLYGAVTVRKDIA